MTIAPRTHSSPRSPRRHLVVELVDELCLQCRHDAPARQRFRDVQAAGVGGDDAVRLGEAVPRARCTTRQRLVDLVDQVRLQGSSTAAHPGEGRGVAAIPVGVHQQFATHRRHAGEVRDTLALDQLEGPTRIPLVGEHDARTRNGGRVEQTVVGRHVEQRRRRHEDVLLRLTVGTHCRRRHDAGLCGGETGDRGHERKVQQIVHRPAMGELCALGEPRGAGRVEDAGIVVGIDVDRRQFGRSVRWVDDILPSVGVVGELTVEAHGHQVQRCLGAQCIENGKHTGDALAVGDEHLRS